MGDLIERKAAVDAVTLQMRLTGCSPDLMAARDLIRNLPSAQRWIPCCERLPEDRTEVFVYLFNRQSPYIAWIEDTHWYTEDFEVDREDEPIAWIPLPEPFREEGEQE